MALITLDCGAMRLLEHQMALITSDCAQGTFCWNTGRHLQCYHAIPCMGSVIHTLNIRLSPKELSYIITHAGDR